jgi:hypothetical protein
VENATAAEDFEAPDTVDGAALPAPDPEFAERLGIRKSGGYRAKGCKEEEKETTTGSPR